MSILYPDGVTRCLLVFSTPFRAAEYARILLASGPRVKYLSSSPLQFTCMLRDLERPAVKAFTIDRCPRCSIFTSIHTGSIRGAADVVRTWAICKATELARTELYLAYASGAMRAGRLKEARDVTLQAVGHASLEDPRLHLLLGQLAVGLGDGTLLREAKAFLRFLNLPAWERMLKEAEQSRSPNFTRFV